MRRNDMERLVGGWWEHSDPCGGASAPTRVPRARVFAFCRAPARHAPDVASERGYAFARRAYSHEANAITASTAR